MSKYALNGTGRHAVRSGMYPDVQFPNSLLGLPLEDVTLPEVLKQEGFSTGMVGKWHLGVGEDGAYLPTNQGYDTYFGIPYSHDMCPFLTPCYPGQPCDAESPHPATSPCPLYSSEQIVEQPTELTSLTSKMAEHADMFITDSVKKETPFFLFYAFHQVHFPQFSSSMFRNSSIRGAFGDSVSEMDWAVGRLVSTLQAAGVYNDTVIIFTSDNGPRNLNQGRGQGGSSGPFKCGKGTTYEGGQRYHRQNTLYSNIITVQGTCPDNLARHDQPWGGGRADVHSGYNAHPAGAMWAGVRPHGGHNH